MDGPLWGALVRSLVSYTPQFQVENGGSKAARALESIDNCQRSLAYAGPFPLNFQ